MAPWNEAAEARLVTRESVLSIYFQAIGCNFNVKKKKASRQFKLIRWRQFLSDVKSTHWIPTQCFVYLLYSSARFCHSLEFLWTWNKSRSKYWNKNSFYLRISPEDEPTRIMLHSISNTWLEFGNSETENNCKLNLFLKYDWTRPNCIQKRV